MTIPFRSQSIMTFIFLIPFQDKRRVWQDVQDFRKSCQRFEDRREFDLNDKRKCAYAARLHDEDVRNGPASMQKYTFPKSLLNR